MSAFQRLYSLVKRRIYLFTVGNAISFHRLRTQFDLSDAHWETDRFGQRWRRTRGSEPVCYMDDQIFVLVGISTFLRSYLFTVAGERIVTRLQERLFEQVLSQEIGFSISGEQESYSIG